MQITRSLSVATTELCHFSMKDTNKCGCESIPLYLWTLKFKFPILFISQNIWLLIFSQQLCKGQKCRGPSLTHKPYKTRQWTGFPSKLRFKFLYYLWCFFSLYLVVSKRAYLHVTATLSCAESKLCPFHHYTQYGESANKFWMCTWVSSSKWMNLLRTYGIFNFLNDFFKKTFM